MKRLMLFLCCSAMSFTAISECSEGYCLQPFVGVDAHYAKGLSMKNTDHNTPKIGVYGGLKLTDSFGLEVGGTVLKKKKSGLSNLKRKSFDLLAVWYAPVSYTSSVLLGAGASHSMLKLTGNKFKDKVYVHKTVPKLMAGIESRLSEELNLRLSCIWEKSKNIRHKEINNKNSFHYGVGLRYNF